jgi:hypothetical protein
LRRHPLIKYTALATVATVLINPSGLAIADTRIRGEFEYNIDDQAMSEWQVGPIFSLNEAETLEMEIPIGQNDSVWSIQPELIYELEANDLTIEFSAGFEAFFDGQPIQGFGGIEGKVEF